MADDGISRRHFFFGVLLTGAIPPGGFGSVASLQRLGYKSPNEKLNIASIGAGGRAGGDIRNCESENIVALVDTDSVRAQAMFKKYEKVPKYTDFRKMLDREGQNIDAVIIAIPDHMHGMAAMWCMERGKHVYVEKPLTRTIWEARMLTEAAAKFKVATQMGNQGYSNEGARIAAEIIWSGEIGNVTEVHAWTNRPVWPQGITELPKEEPVPKTLDWDSWLGIQHMRPYSSAYLPFNWRGWFDFGSGSLGDMACHILGAVNMALMLTAPTSVEVIQQEGKNPYSFPKSSTTRFDFPARQGMPPVKLFWYDARRDPPMRPQGLAVDEMLIGSGYGRPTTASGGDAPGGAAGRQGGGRQGGGRQGGAAAAGTQNNGAVFIGEKGIVTTDTYAANCRLLPSARMKDYQLPAQVLTRSPGHVQDWFRACKGGDPSCSDFRIAGPFTEWIQLGSVALHFEGRLDWDRSKMKFTNRPEANEHIKPKFRKGWKFA